MRTKTVSLIVLGAVVCAAIAFRFFGPEEAGDTEIDSSEPPGEIAPAVAQDTSVAAERAEPNVNRDAESLAPVLLPHQTAPTPMIQALRDAAGSGPRGSDINSLSASPPQQMVDSEQAFAAEPRDREWATATEASILSKIAESSGLTVIDLQAECRTTVCRVMMVEPRRSTPNPTPNVFVSLIDTVGLTAPWIISLVNPQGGLTSVAYMSREPAAEPGSP